MKAVSHRDLTWLSRGPLTPLPVPKNRLECDVPHLLELHRWASDTATHPPALEDKRTQRRTHRSVHPRTREAYAALKPCALIQLVLIRCTSRTLSQPPQRLPCSSPHPGYVCPPICVSSNHSSPPPFILPFLHFHILLAKERTFLCSFF